MGATASVLIAEAPDSGFTSSLLQQVLDYSKGIDNEVLVSDWCEVAEAGIEDGWHGVLNCECVGEGLSLAEVQPFVDQAIGLSLASNSLQPSALADLVVPNSLHILCFGGNCVSVPDLCRVLPAANELWVLDLGFTENLCVGDGFRSDCRLAGLIRLVLDGCSLSSTLVTTTQTESDPASSSIFQGLSTLRQLSLKENLIQDTASLAGLLAVRATLASLALQDNPINDTKAGADEVQELAREHFPRLQLLDGKPVHRSKESNGETGAVRPVQLQRVDGGSTAVGGIGGSGLDQMEKEYLMALKGEQDNSVVA